MILNKQIIRELKQNIFRYLGVLLLIVIGIAVVTGYNCAARSVSAALYEARESGNVEDGDFQTKQKLSSAQLKKIQNMGFETEEQFYYDYEKSGCTLRLFAVRDEMNQMEASSGSEDISEDEIFLDRLYAETNGYEIGDTLKIEDEKYIVKGTGCVPDYILIISDLTSNSSDAEKFGLGFLNAESFQKLSQDELTYNYAFRYDEDWSESEQEDKISELRTYLKDECGMTGFLKNEDSTRVIGVFSKLDSDKSTALMLGAVIILIIAFLFFAITKATITRECAAIGTLYALGYTEREIRRYYIKIPLVLTGIGTIVGYILGSRVMMDSLIASSYAFYCIPNVTMVPSVLQILATIVLPLLMVAVINEIGLLRYLNAEPLQLIRKDLKKGHEPEIRLPHFSFFTRFRLRVLLQSVADNLLLVVGMILSCFLMIMGIGMHDSISSYIDRVEDSVPSEYVYMLNAETEAKNKDAEKLKVVQFHYDFAQADVQMPITCYGIAEDSDYIDILPPDKKEIIVSDVVAEKFGFAVGDRIELESVDGEDTYKLTVADICEFPNGLYIFMGMDELNSLVGDDEGSYNAYFSDKELNLEDAYVASTITREDIIESANQYYDMTAGSVKIMIVAAVIIAVILMFVIFEMTIDKNKTNISLTKVLGYTSKELDRIYIGGKVLVVLAGLVIAMLIDIPLMKSMWPGLILTFRGFMPFEISTVHILAVILAELAAYLVIRWITAFGLEKVELTYILKDRG